MHLQDGEGLEEISFTECAPTEQIILSPKVATPFSKKGKAVARHNCRNIIASRDIRVCFEKCAVSFVIRV